MYCGVFDTDQWTHGRNEIGLRDDEIIGSQMLLGMSHSFNIILAFAHAISV